MYTILTTMIHISATETSPFSTSIHLLVPVHHPAVSPAWLPPHRQPQDPGAQPCFGSVHCEETLSPRPLSPTLCLADFVGIFTSPGTKFTRPCLSPYPPSPMGLIIPCQHIAHFLPSSPFSPSLSPPLQGLTVFKAIMFPWDVFNYPCATHMHHHLHLPHKIPEPIKSSTHLAAL